MTANSKLFVASDRETDSFRHDLRTHLSAIVSLTDLVASTPDPAQRAPLLDALRLAADNAMAMTEDGQPLTATDVATELSLSAHLEEFERLAKGLSLARGSAFSLKIDPALHDQTIQSPDPVYLHRVLMLLLDNALKYGQGTDICLSADLLSANTIDLEFSDLGPGFGSIDPDTLFEPYQRGEGSDAISGTGLGLWSARHIIATMGGTIKASLNLPTGAVFSIHLPRTAPIQASNARANEEDRAACRSTGNARPLNILVVDDNQTNHLIMSELIGAMGCKTLHATSGAEALEMLSRSSPDCAIVDIRMDGMDGWELAEQILGTTASSDLPLIAISSDKSPEKIDPFVAWIERPVHPEDLYALIKRVENS